MKKLLFSGLSLILLASACGPSSTNSTTGSSSSNKSTLRVNFISDPPTLDPRKGGDVISSMMQFMLFEGLTKMTPESSTALGVAKKIDLSPDLKTYTFHLRDATWSDGMPVTAMDFEKAWKDMLSPNFPCPNANLLYSIRNSEKAKNGEVTLDEVGIKSIDAKTFQVELEHPTPYFLDLTSFCVFFPVPHHITKEHADWADNANPNMISNGPFSLEKWHHNDELIAVKSETYWDHENVSLNKIQISLIADENTALHLFEKGELDIIGHPFCPIPLDSLPFLEKEGKVLKSPIGATTMCSFNLNSYPLNNKNIRKAFATAINRKAIVENITQLGEVVATGAVPPILKADINNDYFSDGNAKLAQEYFQKGLEELGIEAKDFPEIKMNHLTSDTERQVAQALQQQWLEVLGARVTLEHSEFKVYLNQLVQKDFQIGQFMWIAQYNDQMNILDRFKFKNNPKNYPGWESQDYINLLDESMSIRDEKQRLEVLEKAEQIFVDEMPIASVFHWNCVYMKNPKLEGYFISPIGSVHLERVQFKDE